MSVQMGPTTRSSANGTEREFEVLTEVYMMRPPGGATTVKLDSMSVTTLDIDSPQIKRWNNPPSGTVGRDLEIDTILVPLPLPDSITCLVFYSLSSGEGPLKAESKLHILRH